MDCVLRWKRLTLNYVFKRKVPNLINTMDTAKLFNKLFQEYFFNVFGWSSSSASKTSDFSIKIIICIIKKYVPLD